MPDLSLFSTSYAEARERFIDAAGRRAARLTSYRNDRAAGPAGEPLCADVAVIEGSGSGKALVLVSGTHGAEGFAGSACQAQLLAGEPSLPPDSDVVLLHALNPFGFAYGRRVNEDNVDINRNFVDHDRPPVNERYAIVHPALVPADWQGPAHRAADELLGRLAVEWGLREVQFAITGGQYSHHDGLFFGGTAATWSNRTWRAVVRDFLRGYDEIAYIDLHTGLGRPMGVEPIFRGGRDAHALARARSWYGPSLTESEAGTASSTPIDGNTARALAEELPASTLLTAITLEFGTQDGLQVLNALRADNWLWQHRDGAADPASDEQRATIAGLMVEAFGPRTDDWRAAVLTGGAGVIAAAVRGLRRSDARVAGR